MWFSKSFVILLILLTFNSVGQNSFHFYEPLIPDWEIHIQKYISQDKVEIEAVREATDLLTNFWKLQSEDLALSKRKKAVVRHVKHISEQIELSAATGKVITVETKKLLYELEFLRRSYLDQSWSKLNNEVTFSDKVEMLKSTVFSKRKMSYFKHFGTQYLDSATLFWHPVNGLPHKEFGRLAKAKKIDADNEMIVLFDELSLDGSAPKIKTKDLDLDNEWTLKWGDEVHSDVVGSRLFAALGYDVDHPYYYGEGKVVLILDSTSNIKCWNDLKDSIWSIYEIDLSPFFLKETEVTQKMIDENDKLRWYEGSTILTFKECALEARPDRVKRLGSFLPNELANWNRTELRAALLAHVWIDNWDVREQNTLLTTVHNGNYQYRVSAVFSDLGTSMGVKTSPLSGDFKVGLVNELGWKAAKSNRRKVKLLGRINASLGPYKFAQIEDLRWMAEKIAEIDSTTLRKCIEKSGWPPAVQELYFHKMASRRASILTAFDVDDEHPISFDQKLNFEDGAYRIKNGKLIEVPSDEHPEGLTHKKGRMRNYGN